MARFLVFALTLLVVLVAIFHLALELAGFAPDLGPLVGWHEGTGGLPGVLVLGTWMLEALALTTLFLLVDRGGGSRWLNGVLAGWIAWVFRGPLLVLTATGFGGLAPRPWWQLAFRWFVLYTLAGLLLAALARWQLDRPRRPPLPRRGAPAAAAAGSASPASGPASVERQPPGAASPHAAPPHAAPPDAEPPSTEPPPER